MATLYTRSNRNGIVYNTNPDYFVVRPAGQRSMDRCVAHRCRLAGDGAVYVAPCRRCHGGDDMGSVIDMDLDRVALVYLDGRNPIPHEAIGRHLQGLGAMAGSLAGSFVAHE